MICIFFLLAVVLRHTPLNVASELIAGDLCRKADSQSNTNYYFIYIVTESRMLREWDLGSQVPTIEELKISCFPAAI